MGLAGSARGQVSSAGGDRTPRDRAPRCSRGGLGISRVAMLRLGLGTSGISIGATSVDPRYAHLQREAVIWRIIPLAYRYMERLTGTDRQTLIRRIPMIGAAIERIEEDHVDVEFFPDRPDLYSAEVLPGLCADSLGSRKGCRSTPSIPQVSHSRRSGLPTSGRTRVSSDPER